ncbi:ROK family transcriptional regulator [Metabacillus idriensis]|uniref:ROK family transcriptional regulator n=1 Tax=Metabacillus idriensis TaxID=324768 RepID=UPI003D2741B4
MTFTLKTGSFEGMRSLNQSSVLNVIRLREPISRAEIAKITNLTRPTVGDIVNNLVEQNLVMEKESISSRQGGRKPIMLSINYTARYILGIYAAAEIIRVSLSTIDGQFIYDHSKELKSLPDKEEFIEIVKECIYAVLNNCEIEQSLIIGIGFAMHGLVNPEKGTSIFSPHLHLDNIPIKEILEREFLMPVMVENDVRALALAESWFGQGKGVSDFICISVGRGIGSGIVMNNELYKSSYYTAGEIGHTVLDMDGPLCECGNQGCLEAYASEAAIIKKALNEADSAEYTQLNPQALTIETIMHAAENGDSLAVRIIDQSAKSLGLATANLINILKPSKIILEGRIFEQNNLIISCIKEMVNKYTIRSKEEEVEIVCSSLGKKGMVLGAVSLVAKKMFEAGGLNS